MSSPYGIFVSLSLEELQTLKASVLARAASGDTIQLSGAGKSKGKSYSLSVLDALKELNFAIGLLTGQSRPSQTHFDVAGQGVFPLYPYVQ